MSFCERCVSPIPSAVETALVLIRRSAAFPYQNCRKCTFIRHRQRVLKAAGGSRASAKTGMRYEASFRVCHGL